METTKKKKISLGELLSGAVPESTEISDVQLTDQEKEEVLQIALEKKKERAEYDQKILRQKAIEQEIACQWSSNDMLEWIRWRCANKLGIQFILDERNHEVIKALCRYFTNDPKFEEMKEGWSLDKGILLAGTIGTGKTTIMKAFASNKRGCFKVMSCRKMADLFADQGPEVMHTYSKLLNEPLSASTFYQNQLGLCFDDLGTERVGKRYGDSVNVMEQIILNRYDNSDAAWHYTHITTNLTAEEIEQYYGSRVRSRMREMFNLVTLTGEDRRK
jgi:DNA replication protein DnaC